jgi:hypothetical protein
MSSQSSISDDLQNSDNEEESHIAEDRESAFMADIRSENSNMIVGELDKAVDLEDRVVIVKRKL